MRRDSSPAFRDVSASTVGAVAWAPVLAVALLVAFTHALVATRFGWHRDEFYYVATGRRLAWGYVDQPPLTPLLARFAASVASGVWPLRALAIAFQVGSIVLGALIARELGGRSRAQALAAGCVAACPIFVGASLFLGTTPTDQFMWALIVLCVIRAIRKASIRSWIGAGVAAGVGLENKHTVAVLVLGIFLGLASVRREVLRTPGPWVAGVVGAILWAPNLAWDARHHWETLDMARVLADKQGGAGGAIAQLPLLLFLFPGPLILFIAMRGVVAARRGREGAEVSWLVPAALFIVVVVALAGGKPYYSAPLLVPFFALGAVVTERRHPRGSPWTATIVLVACSAVISAVFGLPYLSPSFATATRPFSAEPMETYGWPGFAAQVSRMSRSVPGAVAVYASNYGETGALKLYGHSVGLSLPIVTGQNAYRDWGPPPGTPTEVIAVGEFDRAFLLESWRNVQQIARIKLPGDLKDEETENDARIFRCSEPKGSWTELWPKLSYLS